MKQFMRTFAIALIAIVAVAGIGSYLFFQMDNASTQKKNEERKIDSLSMENGVVTNVLVVGVDAMSSSKVQAPPRTDTMILMSINRRDNKVTLLSVPRDSKVDIAGHGESKINAAHAFGGMNLTIKTVEDALQVPVHHYVKLEYEAVIKLIDGLGGLEIDVPQDMQYEDIWADPPLHIDLKAGKQKLNGEQAMGFLRYRKGYADQDLGRIEAQLHFTEALTAKLKSPSIALALPSMLSIYNQNVETDMSKQQLMLLARDVLQISQASGGMQKEVVPGKPRMLHDISYFIIDENALSQITERTGMGTK